MNAQRHRPSWLLQVPPPVLYAACFGAGWLFNRAVVWSPAWVRETWVRSVAWLLLLSAAALVLWSATQFLRRRTTVIPHGQPTQLITGGPFAFSRNPVYVALTAAYIAGAVLSACLWPLLLLPGPMLFLKRVVIPFEEQQLGTAFGARYDDYRGRVRRWL